MAAQGRELLGEYHDGGQLTQEQVRALGSMAVTQDGQPVSREEVRGKFFRFANRGDASGYPSWDVEETGQGAPLTFLQHA